MELEADVSELGGRDLIVGMAWLITEEAVIDCKQYTITFPDEEQWNCKPVPLPTVEDGTWEDALNGKQLIILDLNKFPLFSKLDRKEQAYQLPSHSKYDNTITFRPDTKIPNGSVYRMLWEEDEALIKYLDQIILDGKIRWSSLQAS